MAGRKKKKEELPSTEPLTPKALRRELKRLERDLAKARSRRDQSQARLEALEVLGAQLAADLDAAVAAEAWVAEGAAVAEAAAETAETTDAAETVAPDEPAGTAEATAGATGSAAAGPATEPPTPATDNEPVPIATPRPRRRRTPPATPPAESA